MVGWVKRSRPINFYGHLLLMGALHFTHPTQLQPFVAFNNLLGFVPQPNLTELLNVKFTIFYFLFNVTRFFNE